MDEKERAERISHLLAAAFAVDFGFEGEEDPIEDARLYLLARIAVTVDAILEASDG